uniref:RNase H type-1 domain-containing protein n=1 Tax=Cannabis sativa TaxID=3483 RepID=A0A803P414_CANSA
MPSILSWMRILGKVNIGPRCLEKPVKSMMSYEFIFMADASWLDDKAELAMVMIQKDFGVWAMNTCRSNVASALDAEIQAMFLALQWAKNERWDHITIVSDAQTAIMAFEARECPPAWNCWHTSYKVLEILVSFVCCNFYHMPRNSNVLLIHWLRVLDVLAITLVLFEGKESPL